MKTRRWTDLLWLTLFMGAAVAAAALTGCGGLPNRGVAHDPSPHLGVEPSITADGDVRQHLETIQQTLSDIKNIQESQSTELIGRMEGVESVVQNVENVMHDIGPNQQQLEEKRLDTELKIGLTIVAVFAGMLMIALAAPAVGGLMVTVFYITGTTLIAAPAVFLLLMIYLTAL